MTEIGRQINLPNPKAPRLSCLTLQHVQKLRHFLFPESVDPESKRALPCPLEVPRSGFGYPLCGFCSQLSRKPFSAFNALGFHSLELFSFLVISLGRFQPGFRSWASSQNLFKLRDDTSAVYSHQKSRVPLLFAPRIFRSGRDLLLF